MDRIASTSTRPGAVAAHRIRADRVRLATILLIAALGAGLIAYAYWPGIMIDDTRWQYQQAVDNAYEDWHPPLMAWVWRRLMFIQPGPAPMFVVQVVLYWAGILLIAGSAYRSGRPRLAIALACLGWLPASLALTGTITKDCLMAGCLGCSAGLLLWRQTTLSRASRIGLSAGAFAMLLVAAALRFNAFLACLPLALVAAPRVFTRTLPRAILTGLAASLAFMTVGPAINQLLQAEKTGVEQSLIIFDLGGITEHSGVSQFPDMQVKDPVAVNHRCYDPYQWDSYSSWAKEPCPLGFDKFQSTVDENDLHPIRMWLTAIVHHPIAYAEHRLAHFNVSTWFLTRTGPQFTAWSQSVPNPWGYQVRQSPALKGVTELANAAAVTPLGWPIFWISLGFAALIVALSAGLSAEVCAIAASAPLYGLGYLAFGVATGMRYHFWTVSGAALGAMLVAGELLAQPRFVPRRAMASALFVVALPTLLAILWRVAG